MQRAFYAFLFCLTIAASWPSSAHAQVPAGCQVDLSGAVAEQTESLFIPNEKTGVKEQHYVHRSRASITCNDVRILADVLDLNTVTNLLVATGNVIFIEQGTRIAAERAEFDTKTQTGTFFVASGTLGLQDKPGATSATNHKMDPSLFGNVEPDAFFHGQKIEKLGRRTYRLTKGGFTTCVQPTPRWEMTADEETITVGDHAVIKNMVLRVKDVPLFYLPILYYPIHNNQRATGILMPTYGSSSVRGVTLSNAFFWAMKRNEDLTLYHDWFSKAGMGYGSEYRYVAGGASFGNVKGYVLNQKEQLASDGTVVLPAGNSYTLVSSLSQAFGSHVRMQATANYFSSEATQQLFQQNLADLTQRDRFFSANLYGVWGPWRLSSLAEVHDSFTGLTSETRYGSLPKVSFNFAQTPIAHSKVYVGFNSEFASIVHEATVGVPSTDTGLSRLDLSPTIRAPLVDWSFLTINTSASWRYTSWSESLTPEQVKVNTPIDRSLFVMQASIEGPVLSRIFDTPTNGYANKFKSLIEPTFTIRHVTTINDANRIVFNDYAVDQIAGGVTALIYGLKTDLFAKRPLPDGSTTARDILTVGISQTYYTDQTAAALDLQYQSTKVGQAPSPFTPLALNVEAYPTEHINAQSRFEYDTQVGAMRSVSAGGGVDLSSVHVNVTYSKQFLIPTLLGFDTPAALANTLGLSASLRALNSPLTAAYSSNYDFTNGYMLQQRITGTYNSQCCGVAFEYQTVYLGALGPRGILRDQRFNISFTLAGLGTFSNPMGAFGGVK